MRFSVILYHRCECGKCEVMPTARESICCREISAIDNKLQESSGGNPCCITEHEGFQPVCLDVWVAIADSRISNTTGVWKTGYKWTCTKLVHTMMYICKYIYVYI